MPINTKKTLFSVVFICGIFIFGANVFAATRYWDGGGADNNWSTAANWSSDTIPTSADDVVFSATSIKDSVWNAAGPSTIKSLNASSTYTGTLSIATSTVSVNGNWTYSAANFNAGTSTLKFICSATTFTPGTVNYYNLELAKANGCGNLSISGTATTTNNLTISDGNISVNSGNINVQGNIYVTASSFNGGTATTTLNGTGNQTLLASNTGKLPIMVVNKPLGTLYLNGSINLGSSWTYATGTIDAGTSTLRFSSAATQYFTGGTETYNTIEFAKPTGGGNLFIVGTATTTNFTVAVNTNGTVLNGTLNIIGDINMTASSFSGGDAAATFNIDGTGSQIISSAGGELPNITINKPSGSLYLQGTIPLDRNWTYTTGTVDAGTSTLKFVGGTNQTFTGGTVNYYNLELAKATGTGFLTVSDTATTTNNFINSNGTNNTLNTGIVNVGGNIVLTTTAGLGGTATINMNGTGTQSITSSGAKLPTLSINKSTGQVTIDSNLTVEDNLNITTGELLINTTTTMTVTGATVVSSGGTWTNYQSTSTIFFGSTITNNGTINFNGGGSSCGDADTLRIRSTAASQRSWSGTGTFNIQDADISYQSGSAAITVYSGTNSGNNGTNWTFNGVCPGGTVSCSASASTTVFGTLTDSAISTSTSNVVITMSCTYSAGCALSVLDAGSGSNPGLWNSTSSALVESPNAAFNATSTLLAGTEGYGIQAMVASGTTLIIAPRYNQTGNTVGGLSLSAITLASSTASWSGDETVQVVHKAGIANNTPAGNYNDTITYGCVGN